MNFETIKCQVSFFYGRLTFVLGLFCPNLPTVKVLAFIGIFVKSTDSETLAILATVSFISHFDYEYQR